MDAKTTVLVIVTIFFHACERKIQRYGTIDHSKTIVLSDVAALGKKAAFDSLIGKTVTVKGFDLITGGPRAKWEARENACVLAFSDNKSSKKYIENDNGIYSGAIMVYYNFSKEEMLHRTIYGGLYGVTVPNFKFTQDPLELDIDCCQKCKDFEDPYDCNFYGDSLIVTGQVYAIDTGFGKISLQLALHGVQF